MKLNLPHTARLRAYLTKLVFAAMVVPAFAGANEHLKAQYHSLPAERQLVAAHLANAASCESFFDKTIRPIHSVPVTSAFIMQQHGAISWHVANRMTHEEQRHLGKTAHQSFDMVSLDDKRFDRACNLSHVIQPQTEFLTNPPGTRVVFPRLSVDHFARSINNFTNLFGMTPGIATFPFVNFSYLRFAHNAPAAARKLQTEVARIGGVPGLQRLAFEAAKVPSHQWSSQQRHVMHKLHAAYEAMSELVYEVDGVSAASSDDAKLSHFGIVRPEPTPAE